MIKVKNKISELISNKIDNDFNGNSSVLDALHLLLNGNYVKYNFNEKIISNSDSDDEDFQKVLSKLNEKSDKRKNNGVYYTPDDVSEYIIANTLFNYVDSDYNKTMNYCDINNKFLSLNKESIDKILFNNKILDPTCGSGEFLLNTLKIKYKLLVELKQDNDNNIINIVKTIYGNDIDDESTDICKIRLFFYIIPKLRNSQSYKRVVKIMNKNFTNYDFVFDSSNLKTRFDIIIGNPPYVEYGKIENNSQLINKFGNIYADVIKNSINHLKKNGTLGFIIPLSYVSTTRMSKIRKFVFKKCSKELILNFADRPDCLFNGVHQKLNIILLKKGNIEHKIYVSNYKHWYKDERKELLNGREVLLSNYAFDSFIPKIGNKIEKQIFDKVFTNKETNIYDFQDVSGKSIYLNMRSCFWIKAFSFNPGSKEYREFKYAEGFDKYILCILNSSLFWLYWTIISDCWHITSKELKYFSINSISKKEIDKLSSLYDQLEKKLEKTKKYVGTKQVDYEYKHKFCKDIIDKIDDELAKIYEFNFEELLYIKNFALNYRIGGSDNDKNN